jgi:hypothetical protein
MATKQATQSSAFQGMTPSTWNGTTVPSLHFILALRRPYNEFQARCSVRLAKKEADYVRTLLESGSDTDLDEARRTVFDVINKLPQEPTPKFQTIVAEAFEDNKRAVGGLGTKVPNLRVMYDAESLRLDRLASKDTNASKGQYEFAVQCEVLMDVSKPEEAKEAEELRVALAQGDKEALRRLAPQVASRARSHGAGATFQRIVQLAFADNIDPGRPVDDDHRGA